MQKKTSLSSIFNSLVGDMSNLQDDQSGSLMGGFAVLSTEHMAKLKGGAFNNNGNCGNCGNCGGCPPENNGNCGNCGNCNVDIEPVGVPAD